MLTRSTIFIIFFLSLSASIFAQRQNIYYLKNSGKNVPTRDSADFVRIISEPDSGSEFYNLKEFYKDGKPKLIGKTSQIEIPRLEGQCVTYYQSGKRKEVANYIKGEKFGDIYSYYPNGKLYTVRRSFKNIETNVHDITIQANNDSTGKALVTDGNGYYIGYDNNFAYIEEEGEIKNGLREGEWKGQNIYKEKKTTFIEKYENGKLISGQAVINGVTSNYTQREVVPKFTGGEVAFGLFLRDHVRYPKEDKERNIQGRVIIKFVVEKDGKLADLEIFKSPSESLAAEGLRVLKLCPPWIPGYQMGVPVRVQYTVPINFSLSR